MKKRILLCLSMFLLMLCVSQPKVAEAKTTKAEYTTKTEKVEYKDEQGRVRGIVSYTYPQVKGTSDQIKNVNRAIKKKCDSFMKSENAKSLKGYTLDAIKNNSFYDEKEQYYYKTTCKVTYNKNNVISVAMTWKWYAGGACNEGSYGFNYNLETGKKLGYKDVISGNAKTKILEAVKKYLEKNAPNNTTTYDIVRNMKSFKFYFKANKVYICFESYELDLGASAHKIVVSGKYK